MAQDTFAAQTKRENIQAARYHHREIFDRRQIAFLYLSDQLEDARMDLEAAKHTFNNRKDIILQLEKSPSRLDQARVILLTARNNDLEHAIQEDKISISRMEQEMQTLYNRGAR